MNFNTSPVHWGLALLIALPVSLCFCPEAAAQSNIVTVQAIHYFGCDGIDVDAVKRSLPMSVGEQLDEADSKHIKEEIQKSVKKAIGKTPTDVALVNCGHNTWIIYIGLPGKSVCDAVLKPDPKEHVELPEEGTKLYAEKGRLLKQVLALKGVCKEDDSKGYSLAIDPGLRSIGLKSHEWAMFHDEIIRRVLQFSSDAYQRNVAADLLGMEDPSGEQIKLLVSASLDGDGAVRNSATRALGCIASSKTNWAGKIPRGRFIEMLNSGTWLDRNKGLFVISALSRKDAVLVDRVSDEAFQSLCDMAAWDQQHAYSAQLLLGKIAALSDDQLNKLLASEDITALVEIAKEKHLRAILKEIFNLDQSDPMRTNAYICYKKLVELGLQFEKTNVIADWDYSMSFETFHLGQSESKSNKTDLALQYFKKSADFAHRAVEASKGQKDQNAVNQDWANYVDATLAYLANDADQLQQLKSKRKHGGNERVLTRLLEGLTKSGSPDYWRDYAGVPEAKWTALDQIYAADQSAPSGEQSAQCYNKLLALESQFTDSPYCGEILSHLAFHAAQFDMEKTNSEAAQEHLGKSLGHAEDAARAYESRQDRYNARREEEWANYIKATIAYLKNDVDQMQALQDRCAGRSIGVSRLADQLMIFGTPNYSRDLAEVQPDR